MEILLTFRSSKPQEARIFSLSVFWKVFPYTAAWEDDKIRLIHEYGDQITIGTHVPFGPAKPVPEDDEELERQVEAFMAPYKDVLKENPFFLMDLRPTDRMRAAFYRYGRKALGRD